jgi:hypothetical protein
MSGGRVGLLPLSILFSSAEYAQPPSSLATRPEEASRCHYDYPSSYKLI